MCVWGGGGWGAGGGLKVCEEEEKGKCLLPLVQLFIKLSIEIVNSKYVALGVYVCSHSHEDLLESCSKTCKHRK